MERPEVTGDDFAEEYLAEYSHGASLVSGGGATFRALALVAEVIHGAPTRFSDPARFSFAHGRKDGYPFRCR